MAGNTKFMGFGGDNKVTLSRWKETVVAELSPDSVEALRSACFKGLPKKPPNQQTPTGVTVDYDEDTGSVLVRMTPASALDLSVSLPLTHNDLSANLKSAFEDHIDFHSIDEEPGIDD